MVKIRKPSVPSTPRRRIPDQHGLPPPQHFLVSITGNSLKLELFVKSDDKQLRSGPFRGPSRPFLRLRSSTGVLRLQAERGDQRQPPCGRPLSYHVTPSTTSRHRDRWCDTGGFGERWCRSCVEEEEARLQARGLQVRPQVEARGVAAREMRASHRLWYR